MPDRYQPTQKMQRTARAVLNRRKKLPPSRRAGTDKGLSMARKIANGDTLSDAEVLDMYAFMSRMGKAEGDKSDLTSKLRQSLDLWGNDLEWATTQRNRVMKRREMKKRK